MSVTAGFDNRGKFPVVEKPETKTEDKAPAKKPAAKTTTTKPKK